MWILLHPPALMALFPLQLHASVAEEAGGQTEEEVVVRVVLWFRPQPYQVLRISASLWGRVEVNLHFRVLLLQVRAPKFHSLVSLLLLPVVAQAAQESWERLVEERAGLVEGVVVTSPQPVVRASKAEPVARAMVIMVAPQLVLEEEALGKQEQMEVTVWLEMVVTDISYPLPLSCRNLLQVGVLER
jgi:hypothetical protein